MLNVRWEDVRWEGRTGRNTQVFKNLGRTVLWKDPFLERRGKCGGVYGVRSMWKRAQTNGSTAQRLNGREGRTQRHGISRLFVKGCALNTALPLLYVLLMPEMKLACCVFFV